MSRVIEFSDGAERGDTTWWSSTGTGISVNTASAIHGTYCYALNITNGVVKTITTGLSELYFRCYVKYNSVGPVITFRNSTTAILTLTMNTTLWRWDITTATTGNTGNNSVSNSALQCLEVHYKISDTVGELTIRIDGTQVFTFSGDTKPGADTTVDNMIILANAYFDDFALDTATWCGLGYYIGLTANGAGDSTQWTPTGGANYANVEIPANDSTYNSGTTGQTDNYALTNPSIGASSILRVIPFARANNPAGGTLNIGLRTYATNYGTAVTTPTSLTWLPGAEYTTNPNSGNAWGASELDSLEFYLNVP